MLLLNIISVRVISTWLSREVVHPRQEASMCGDHCWVVKAYKGYFHFDYSNPSALSKNEEKRDGFPLWYGARFDISMLETTSVSFDVVVYSKCPSANSLSASSNWWLSASVSFITTIMGLLASRTSMHVPAPACPITRAALSISLSKDGLKSYHSISTPSSLSKLGRASPRPTFTCMHALLYIYHWIHLPGHELYYNLFFSTLEYNLESIRPRSTHRSVLCRQ
eukprot:m.153358 g.153358  ORF g.153358 m.153358 type:complete len:223 (+) comp15064_c0_seq18:1660-2328(+)